MKKSDLGEWIAVVIKVWLAGILRLAKRPYLLLPVVVGALLVPLFFHFLVRENTADYVLTPKSQVITPPAILTGSFGVLADYSRREEQIGRFVFEGCAATTASFRDRTFRISYYCMPFGKPDQFAAQISNNLLASLKAEYDIRPVAVTKTSDFATLRIAAGSIVWLGMLLVSALFLYILIQHLAVDSVRLASETRDLLGSPIAAVVGRLEATRRDLQFLGNDARSPVHSVDALQHLKVLVLQNRKPPIIIAVTSPVAGDGKTTIAANFSLTCAELGLRTLLIDCDSARPKLSETYNTLEIDGLFRYCRPFINHGDVSFDDTTVRDRDSIDSESRLSNESLLETASRQVRILRGEQDSAEATGQRRETRTQEAETRTVPAQVIACPTVHPMLRVVQSGGTVSSNEVLTHEAALQSMVRALSRSADIVVLDCAPVLLSATAIPFLKTSDAIIFVSSLGSTSRAALARSKEVMAQLGLSSLYSVLNCHLDKQQDYLPASYQSYGYGSHSESLLERVKGAFTA